MLSLKVAKAVGHVAKVSRIAASEAAEHAGQRLAAALSEVLKKKQHARLAIPGGSAANALSFARALLGPSWSSVYLTWVDERCVDVASEDSNRGSAYRSTALSKEDMPGLELPLWLDGENADSAKTRVQAGLEEHFGDGLDVTLLGMGPDGHIASLFPGHPALALDPQHWVAHLSDSPKPPAERMTLTQSYLQRSRCNLLLALGDAKEPALRRLLSADDALPASKLSNLEIITNIDLGAVA